MWQVIDQALRDDSEPTTRLLDEGAEILEEVQGASQAGSQHEDERASENGDKRMSEDGDEERPPPTAPPVPSLYPEIPPGPGVSACSCKFANLSMQETCECRSGRGRFPPLSAAYRELARHQAAVK